MERLIFTRSSKAEELTADFDEPTKIERQSVGSKSKPRSASKQQTLEPLFSDAQVQAEVAPEAKKDALLSWVLHVTIFTGAIYYFYLALNLQSELNSALSSITFDLSQILRTFSA